MSNSVFPTLRPYIRLKWVKMLKPASALVRVVLANVLMGRRWDDTKVGSNWLNIIVLIKFFYDFFCVWTNHIVVFSDWLLK